MFDSVFEDIKRQFQYGNMITKIILLNVLIWAVMALIKFPPATNGIYSAIVEYLSIPGEHIKLMTRPWTVLTHLFIHRGFWHLFWNMLMLYWFGRIVGDLIGDKHILPLYLLGGLAGAVAYVIAYMVIPLTVGSYALGASAAVMAMVMASGRIAPEYEMRLILIGKVKLKFVVIVILLFDLIGAGGSNNTGGHIAHLAGITMGWVFVGQLGVEKDYSFRINNFLQWFRSLVTIKKNNSFRKSPLQVKYKSSKLSKKDNLVSEETVDVILDKIKNGGFNSLSKEERDILAKASKEN